MVRIQFFAALLSLSTLSASAQVVGENAFGARFGMSGGPNGLTYYHVVNDNSAIEMHLGYNDKHGFDPSVKNFQNGVMMLGISFQPFLHAGDRSVGTNFYLDMGVRARIHLYRFRESGFVTPITPDLFAGPGFLLELNEAVELFADAHITFFNTALFPGNQYIPGMESGFGIRFALNN